MSRVAVVKAPVGTRPFLATYTERTSPLTIRGPHERKSAEKALRYSKQKESLFERLEVSNEALFFAFLQAVLASYLDSYRITDLHD